MGTKLLITAALLVQSTAVLATEKPEQDQVDVAYEEMMAGHNRAAVDQIRASGLDRKGDPSALINLGTAYARMGQKDRAMACFKAALASKNRYDVQLADGRWVDTRQIARQSIAALEKADNLALR